MNSVKHLVDLDPELKGLSADVEKRILSILEDRDKIILLQKRQIERQETELRKIKAEKDLLQNRLATHGESFDASDASESVTGVKTYNEAAGRLGQRANSQANASSVTSGGKVVSQNSFNRVQRQRSFKGNADDLIKRSRAPQSSYQLSQDLHDKQVEMLERKYGGSIRSRRAARTIQRAFRQYCMNKNFQKLRHSYGERRLSKRLSELGRSSTVWSDRLSTDFSTSADDNGNLGVFESRSFSHDDQTSLGRDIRNMVADFESNRPASERKIVHSIGQTDNSANKIENKNRRDSNNLKENSRRIERHSELVKDISNGNSKLSRNAFSSPGFHLIEANYKKKQFVKSSSVSSTGSGDATHHHSGLDSNTGSYTDVNASSGGDYVRTPALENSADPQSVDFENLLGKETDILTDSFHSEGSSSMDARQEPHMIGMRSSGNSMNSNLDYSTDFTRMSSSPCTSDSFRTLSSDPSDFLHHSSGDATISSDSVKVKVDLASPSEEHGPVYTKEQMAAAQMKYFMANSQVKYRCRDSNNSLSSLSTAPLTSTTSSLTSKPPNVAIVAPTRSTDSSPIWKRKGEPVNVQQQQPSNNVPPTGGIGNGANILLNKTQEPKRMSNISETSEPDSENGANSSSQSSAENASTENIHTASETSLSYQRKLRMSITPDGSSIPRSNDKQRKRLYRIGLNLFNKKPEKGLDFLLDNLFLEGSARSVAKFFITRKGLSKQMIGEFLGNILNPFNQEVLRYFCEEIDLSGHQVDVALRRFQMYFRMPGEAQKIERLMEAFADRYCFCNPDQVKNFKNPDTVFLLAFAIIMLNTDLHNSSVKAERKMKLEDFVKNMRGIDDGEDLDRDLLTGIYDRVKSQEFKPGVDQVTQVMKVEQTIIGKKPVLSLPHRRLVCYCRLYEVHDPNKKEKINLHQREVFLFNDILLVTKTFSKKKTGITYSFRNSLSLCGMQVYLFETSHYQFGIQLTNNIDGKPLITFNARNSHDRQKFVEDLKESILETNGMEQLRIEEEMARHRSNYNTIDKHYAHDDSHMRAYDLANGDNSAQDFGVKKINHSNSLTDLTSDTIMKRGSSGASLDSGMASGSVGSASSDSQPLQTLTPNAANTPRGTPRQAAPRAPIMLHPGLPDGTQV